MRLRLTFKEILKDVDTSHYENIDVVKKHAKILHLIQHLLIICFYIHTNR